MMSDFRNLSSQTARRAFALLPPTAKRTVRAVRLALTPAPANAPNIPQHLLEDCKILSNRDLLLSYLPAHGVVAEIGTLHGDYSRKILKTCTPTALHLIDLDLSVLDHDVRTNPAVKLHQGSSPHILSTFSDSFFDWLYIDGDHTYEGVKTDIAAAVPKLKSGGFLVFNDFARITRTGLGTFGVHQAVCEFATEKNWSFAYFCFQAQALYDVALKKPS